MTSLSSFRSTCPNHLNNCFHYNVLQDDEHSTVSSQVKLQEEITSSESNHDYNVIQIENSYSTQLIK